MGPAGELYGSLRKKETAHDDSLLSSYLSCGWQGMVINLGTVAHGVDALQLFLERRVGRDDLELIVRYECSGLVLLDIGDTLDQGPLSVACGPHEKAKGHLSVWLHNEVASLHACISRDMRNHARVSRATSVILGSPPTILLTDRLSVQLELDTVALECLLGILLQALVEGVENASRRINDGDATQLH